MKKVVVRSMVLCQVLLLLVVCNGYAAQLVQTEDIADRAVTTPKIADGAVTGAKISDASVTSTKIADGGVTDAKISGQISASKVSSVGLDADTLDGLHASQLGFERNYSNIVVVAKQGGDFDNLLDALNSIADASDQNPYLIKIMPGVYDSPSGTYNLKDYVDIEGSGKTNTQLILHNTLYGSDVNTTIGKLTVDVQGVGMSCTSPYNYAKGVVLAGTNNNVAFENMVLQISNASSGTIIQATGNINIEDSVVSNKTSSCSAKYGIYLDTGAYHNNVTIRNSIISVESSTNKFDKAIVANASNNANLNIYSSEVGSRQSIVNGGTGKLRLFVFDSFLVGTNIYYPALDMDSTDELTGVNTQISGGVSFPDPSNVKLFNCYNKNYDLVVAP